MVLINITIMLIILLYATHNVTYAKFVYELCQLH